MKPQAIPNNNFKNNLLTRQQLEDIIKFLPDATFVVDNNKRVIAWNRAIEEMTGVQNKDIIGKGDYIYAVPFYGFPRPLLIDQIFFYAEEVNKLYDYVNIVEHTIFAEVYASLLNEGKGAFLWATASPLVDREGKVVGAIESIRDITKQKMMEKELEKYRNHLEELVRERTKELGAANELLIKEIGEREQAEEALRHSNQRLTDIIEFLPDATVVVDKDKKIIAWNHAMEKQTGIAKQNMLGKNNQEISIPYYGEPRLNLIDLLFSEDKDTEKLYNYVQRKGNVICAETYSPFINNGKGAHLWGMIGPLLDSVGNMEGAIHCIRDITKLRLAEEALAKAFKASPNLMAVSELEDGSYLIVNDRFVKVTGFLQEEVIDHSCLELNLWSSPEDRAKMMRLLAEKGSISNLEISYRVKNGELRDGLFSAEFIQLDGRQCLLSAINDITDYKQLQRDIIRLERLNLIGRMAAGIGHEIRNPMTSVRGFLQMLRSKPECSKYGSWFELMIDELDRANAIITEYLAVANNKKIELKVQNLNTIIETIKPLIIANALNSDKNVKMELEPIWDLYLNQEEIRQLVLNLINNGLEAMSAGGQLTVRTFNNDGCVVMEVADQGQGIQPEVLEKIGTPFFTTKEQGTGLGLAVCNAIIARHNGVLGIKTGPEGSVFSVRFLNM
jgi:PAS domain S-box-containing protein